MHRVMLAALLMAAVSSPSAAFESELQTLATELAAKLNQEGATTTVAVVEFRDLEGVATGLGRFLSDQFSVRLLNSAGFELFNRSKLARLTEEIQLSEEGFVSPESAKRLELEGVQILITGTVTELGDFAQLSVEALRTSTARIVAAATGRVSLAEELRELSGRRFHERGGSASGGLKSGSSQQLILPGAREAGPFRVALTDLKVLAAEPNTRWNFSSEYARVSATFEIQNLSADSEYLAGLAAIDHGTSATDNLSHFCEQTGGLKPIYSWRRYADEAVSLPPNGRNELTIHFTCPGVTADEMGDRFTVTWSIAAFNVQRENSRTFAVSFRDVVLRR